MRKIILRIILVALMIAIVFIYIYDLRVNHSKPTDHLFRTIAIFCIAVSAFIRTFIGTGRKSLEFYSANYKEFQACFETHSRNRRKFLSAIRFYNENKPDKALKCLDELVDSIDKPIDEYGLNFIAALCLVDMGAHEAAEQHYMRIVHKGLADSSVYTNLATLQRDMGKFKLAVRNFEYALEYDKDNPYAYNNIAFTYFKMYEYDNAISYAKKALDINPLFYRSASLLAVIYNLTGALKDAEKYFHIAISNGENPRNLSNTIEYYKSAKLTDTEYCVIEEFDSIESDDE